VEAVNSQLKENIRESERKIEEETKLKAAKKKKGKK